MNASTCSGIHAHGHPPVNAANRRTTRSRPSISGPLSRRLLLTPPPRQHRLEQRRFRRHRRRAVRADQRQRPRRAPSGPARTTLSASTGHPAQPIWMPHPAIQHNREPESQPLPRVPHPARAPRPDAR